MRAEVKFEIRGVKFVVRRVSGSFKVFSEDGRLVAEAGKAKSLTSVKNVRRIVKYLKDYDSGIDVTDAEVVEVLEREVVSKFMPKKGAVPQDYTILPLRLQPHYYSQLDRACAWTYEVRAEEGAKVVAPYLVCYNFKERKHETYDLVNVLMNGGLEFEDEKVLLRPSVDVAAEGEELDYFELRRRTDKYFTTYITAAQGSIPTLQNLLQWIDRVAEEPYRYLRDLVESYLNIVRKYAWRGLHALYRVLALVMALPVAYPATDFVPRVVFASYLPGAGKSYHIRLTSSVMPYRWHVSNATPAVMGRIMPLVLTVAIDEPHISEDLREVLVRGFTKENSKTLTGDDKTPKLLPEGGIIIMPDLGSKIVSENEALRTRSMVINLASDKKTATIVDVWNKLKDEKIRLGDYELTVAESYAAVVALSLVLAKDFYEIKTRLDAEVSQLAKEGKLQVGGRDLQRSQALLMLGRALGQEWGRDVWNYVAKSERPVSPEFEFLMALLSDVADAFFNNREVSKRVKGARAFVDAGVVLAPVKSLYEFATTVLGLGETKEVTETHKVESDEQAEFKLSLLWRRRELPFRSYRDMLKTIESSYVLSRLLERLYDPSSRDLAYYLIITDETIEALQAEVDGNLDVAEEKVREALAKACPILSELISKSEPYYKKYNYTPRVACQTSQGQPPDSPPPSSENTSFNNLLKEQRAETVESFENTAEVSAEVNLPEEPRRGVFQRVPEEFPKAQDSLQSGQPASTQIQTHVKTEVSTSGQNERGQNGRLERVKVADVLKSIKEKLQKRDAAKGGT